MASNDNRLPRLVPKDKICAYLGGISPTTYDAWQQKGLVPGSVPGTTRYDVRAHDAALDRIARVYGAEHTAALSPLERWEADNAA